MFGAMWRAAGSNSKHAAAHPRGRVWRAAGSNSKWLTSASGVRGDGWFEFEVADVCE